MQFTSRYASPLGEMLLASDEEGLAGAWFYGQKYFARGLTDAREERETPLLASAKRWLDAYFRGEKPALCVPLHMSGTEFQLRVWRILMSIPYGETATYGEIARRLAAQSGGAATSARAVGGAVGRNAISIFVPCHRVVGAGGGLTGYAGGVDRKASLLALERAGGAPELLANSGGA